MKQNALLILSILVPTLVFSQVSSKSFKNKNKVHKPFSLVEKMPEFPGGEAALGDFIATHFQVSDSARKSQLNIARIIVRFVVTETGSVSEIKTMNKVGFGLEEEAIRVVGSFPKWKPGTQNGKPVPVYFTLPITVAIDDLPSEQKK
jgi:protein TonB